ncbi:MAG: hypothetical protein HRU80_03715 [Ignavibacteriales bacterium]|nr:MAG: hypothetical protein HRU80_03715 [Ignavibacteriales bacterium]
MSTKENYLLIYLKTGGGHLAPARSVANYLNSVYPDKIHPILVNAFEEVGPISRYLLEDGYRILQAKAQWYYEFLYLTNKLKPIGYWNRYLVHFHSEKYLERMILEKKPSKIIVFHFFSYAPVYKILKKHKLDTTVLTVVTDPFTAHPLWFFRKDQNFIVFSESLRAKCIAMGIPENRVSAFPFILDQKFSTPVPKEEIPALKQKHGFSPDEKLLLLLGGGDGLANAYPILSKLYATGFSRPVAVVCGRNQGLKAKLERMKAEKGLTNLHIFGYVDFVYDLINISDVVITKCGASTFMEILHTQKVPIVVDYLWEQEKGNVEYIVNNNMGLYEKNTSKIPALVHRLFDDEEWYQSFIRNIRQAQLENGTSAVSEYIANF